jgi:spore maturation protein SpmB
MEKWRSLLFVLVIITIVGGVILIAPTISSGTVSDSFNNSVARTMLGGIGAILILVGLAYGAENVKNGNYVSGLVWAFVGALIGIMFVLSWLWS